MRRYVHFGLLVMTIMIVRSCGGAAQAEDRLSFASRWTAEKTGLTGAKAVLDEKVRPPLAAATRSMTYAIYGTASRTLDGTEVAINGFGTWVAQQASNVETAVEMRIRSVLSPTTVREVPPSDSASNKEAASRPSR